MPIVKHIAIARSEYLGWPPRDLRRAAAHFYCASPVPDGQITAIAQAVITLTPIRNSISLPRKFVAAAAIEFVRY